MSDAVLVRAIEAAEQGDLTSLRELHAQGLLASLQDEQQQQRQQERRQQQQQQAAWSSLASPVHHAARAGSLTALRFLVGEARLSARIRTGPARASPAHDAAARGQLACLRYLLEDGACDSETEFTVLNLNHVDGDGVSPLHFAAGGGHCSTMDWLLAHGAKNQVDLTGCYPLHDAADNGHIKCCEILLMHEADVNAKDSWGYTPVDLAEENGHTECVEYLLFQRHNSCEQGATNRKPGRRVTFKLTEGDEIPGSEMDDYEAAELPKLSDLLVAADTDVESSIDIPEPESEGERDFDVISITAEEHSYVPPQAPPPPSHPQINRYDGASLYKTLPCKSGVKKNNLKASSSLNFELIEELKAGKSLKPTQNSNGRLITFVEWNEAKKHEISDCSSNAEAGVGVTPDEEKSCSSESSNAPVTHTSNEETPSKPLNDVSPPSNLNCDFKSEISPANVIIIPLHPDKKKYN
ncbi:uncharacterized protein LOC116939494 isoform X2 [Petromyzon marinus]|uniref:uncharacterized protein LOC116939494 isoform X2 n=1 Tax=Petromyzon marinus TaxID=7757 RepID=UPI003F6F2212